MKNLNDELREHGPLLEPLRKQDDGFRLPENYFESLEGEVFKNLEAIGARRRPAAAKPSWQLRLGAWLSRLWQPRVALSLASVAALALAAWWFFRAPLPTEPAPIAQVEITEEEAEAFVLQNAADFDPEQLAPELPEETLNAPANLQPDDLHELLDELSEDDLEELL